MSEFRLRWQNMHFNARAAFEDIVEEMYDKSISEDEEAIYLFRVMSGYAVSTGDQICQVYNECIDMPNDFLKYRSMVYMYDASVIFFKFLSHAIKKDPSFEELTEKSHKFIDSIILGNYKDILTIANASYRTSNLWTGEKLKSDEHTKAINNWLIKNKDFLRTY